MKGFYIIQPTEIGVHKNELNEFRFRVWAPEAQNVSLYITSPAEKKIKMFPEAFGYWKAEPEGIKKGDRYYYILDGKKKRPDPASQSQPEGVHGPSEVLDLDRFSWEDPNWQGLKPEQMIIYELHTGTFTEAGDFKGIINKLDYLKDLGINTIELMPVNQFPGSRNWGYDGVYPFAVQNSYGGAYQLQKLVNEAHQRGFAVILDVVYNHLGPEGNYLFDYGPYFTDKYHTPWGKAVNFDDYGCDGVRNYFLQNALFWFRYFHIDALRLDAVHAIWDFSAKHIMAEMQDVTEVFNQGAAFPRHLIAECDLNDIKYLNSPDKGGYGLPAQWADDFHHSLHTLLTGEERGYYRDFGGLEHLGKAFRQAFVYDGIYSLFRNKTYGSKPQNNPGSQFVVCTQNHDQVGNRMQGDRLTTLVSFEELKLAAAALFLSPYIPMIFMGEEYGETNPFQYFVSHNDQELNRLVKEGRKKEFESFQEEGEFPEPDDEHTFLRSKISFDISSSPQRKILFEWYQKWIQLRKKHQVFQNFDLNDIHVHELETKRTLIIERINQDKKILAFLNFSNTNVYIGKEDPDRVHKDMNKMLDSADKAWGGKGSAAPQYLTVEKKLNIKPFSVVVYES